MLYKKRKVVYNNLVPFPATKEAGSATFSSDVLNPFEANPGKAEFHLSAEHEGKITDNLTLNVDVSYDGGENWVTAQKYTEFAKTKEHASAVIGTDGSNELTIESNIGGTEGNKYTLIVDADDSELRDLSASFDDDNLTIFLATEEDDPAEQAFIEFGHNIDPLVDGVRVDVDEAGEAGNDYTLTIDDSTSSVRSLSVDLTGTSLTIFLAVHDSGGLELEAAANTPTLIASAINAEAGSIFTASYSGSTAISAPLTDESFAEGSDATYQLDAAANGADTIATLINDDSTLNALFTASNSGIDAITDSVSGLAFTGGTGEPLMSSFKTSLTFAPRVKASAVFDATGALAAGHGCKVNGKMEEGGPERTEIFSNILTFATLGNSGEEVSDKVKPNSNVIDEVIAVCYVGDKSKIIDDVTWKLQSSFDGEYWWDVTNDQTDIANGTGSAFKEVSATTKLGLYFRVIVESSNGGAVAEDHGIKFNLIAFYN